VSAPTPAAESHSKIVMAHRTHLLVALLFGFGSAFGAAGCFTPQIPENLTCGSGGQCPPGQHCYSPTDICVPDGEDPPTPDASLPDATAEPPYVTFGASEDLSGCAVISYELHDEAARRATLRFEYRSASASGTHFIMTPAGSDPGEASVLRVSGSAAGISHRFHWNSTHDLPGTDDDGTLVVHILAPGAPEQLAETPVRVRNAHSTPCDPGFGPIQVTALGGAYSGVSVDMNDDGKADIVGVDWLSMSMSVFFGRGDGHFEAGPELALESPRSLAMADMDQDGDQDFVAISIHTIVPPPPEDPQEPTPDPIDVASIAIVGQQAGELYPARTIATTATGLIAVTGDVDDDGDQDIVAVDGSIWVFANIDPSSLLFADPERVAGGHSYRSVAVRDLDGDGHMELVASWAQGLDVFRQINGVPGVFSVDDSFPVPDGDYPHNLNQIAFGDASGDGLIDIVTSAELGGLAIFQQVPGTNAREFEPQTSATTINLQGAPDAIRQLILRPEVPGAALVLGGSGGSRAWKAGTALQRFDAMSGWGPEGDLVAGDFDGDGATDIAYLNGSIAVSLARSDDSGFLPLFPGPALAQRTRDDEIATAAIGRFTDDGRLSVAVSYADFIDPVQLRIFKQSAAGAFDPWLDFRTSARQLVVADLDRNGLDDLVLSGPGLRIRMQVAAGVWSEELPLGGVDAQNLYLSAVVADVDGDQHDDIAVIDRGSILWLRNHGDGQFDEPLLITSDLYRNFEEWILFVPLDGDDRPDLIVFSAEHVYTLLQSHDVRGRFLPPQDYSMPSTWYGPPLVMDLDRDGVMDVVVPRRYDDENDNRRHYDVVWFRGDPTSAGALMEPRPVVQDTGNVVALALADVDGDSCPDLILSSRVLSAYLQDCGAPGTFPRHFDSVDTGSWKGALRVADLDGDGRPEILRNNDTDVTLLKPRR
jgi:hypothetical protein